jgi:hypothetical protein
MINMKIHMNFLDYQERLFVEVKDLVNLLRLGIESNKTEEVLQKFENALTEFEKRNYDN